MQPIVDEKTVKCEGNMSVGERITVLRKERNITQAELARLLDVSRQAVSKWENGQSSPDTIKLIQLAEILGTEVEYLATGRKPVYHSPPVVVNLVEKVDKVVEKVVEKPVIKQVVRYRYLRNPVEFGLCSLFFFAAGLILGLIL